MPLVLADRVQETSTSSGTGSFTLAGAVNGFQSFAAIGDGNTTYYTITGGNQWEVGIGTYTSSGTTLSRDTVLSSSSGGAKVDFAAGTKYVFVTYPEERAVYVNGTSVVIPNSATIANNQLANSSVTIGSTSVSLGGTASSLDGLSSVTVTQAPSSALQLATKQYVDDQVAAGITIHTPVRVETPTALNATYTAGGTAVTVTDITGNKTLTFSTSPSLSVNDQIVFSSTSNGITAGTAYYVFSTPAANQVTLSLSYNGPELTTLTNGTGLTIGGTVNAGVGATLTNAGTKAALQIDGVTLSVTNRVLVYNQANPAHNGIYTVTTVGTPDPGGTNWVLTRATTEDTYKPDSINGLGQGDYFFVQEGNTGAGESYVLTTNNPLIIGTTNLTFTQFAASQVYSAGTGLTLNGTQFSLTSPVSTALGGTGLTSYTAGDLPYYATGTAFSKLGIGAASTILTSTGSAPQWSAPSGVSVGTATNIEGGAQGSIPYQSGSGATAFLAKNTTATRYLANTGTNNNPNWSQIDLSNGVTGTLPIANGGTGATTLAGANIAVTNTTNTFTAAQTFRAANAVRVENSTSQDAVVVAGRSGGTSNYAVTLTPATLSASSTLTLPNVNDTLAVLGTGQTFTAAQTFRAANSVRAEAASTQDAVVLAGRAGGTSSYAVTLTPTTLSANRTLTLPDASGTILQSGTAVTVAQGGTGLTSGTSGGIPYFSSTSAMSSSGVLTASAIMLGGGAGAAPTTTTTGTGVVTAIGNAVNTTGGLVTQSGTLAANSLLLGGGANTAITSTTTGTGVVTALGISVGSSGAFTTNNAANTFTAAQTFRAANSVRVEEAATQDAIVLAGRAGGTSSYAVTLTPATLSSNATLTLPNVGTDTFAVLGAGQTFTGANTFRTTSGTRFEEAATQDAIVIDGRAGGTSSYAITLTPATLASNTTLTLPNVTSTVAALGATQTFSAAQTFSNAVTFSGTTTNIALGTSQTSGTWTAGGASQTGTITLDQSTKAHTLNIGTGATENATTKTINFGTNGVSGSTTNITIGSATGTTTTQIQGGTLGGTATNSSLLGQFYGNVGNGSYLRIFTYRHTTGADWTGVSTRIQQRIDVTDQGWIEFNPSGNQYGVSINATSAGLVSLNTNGSARLQINSSGAYGLNGANYGTSGQVLTSGGSGAAPSWTTITSPAKASGSIIVNNTTVSENYTIAAGTNGFSVGPVTVASGFAVTVASGQRWVVI